MKNRIQFSLKYCSILTLLLFVTFSTMAQRRKDAPDWTDYTMRKMKFPDREYVVGFSSEVLTSSEDRNDMMERLKDYARIQLIESIQVSIKSIATTNILNANSVTEEYFRRTSVSLSKVNIAGLKEEIYFDEKEKTGYAFAYAGRADIINLYKNNLGTDIATIERNIQNAELYVNNGDNQNALKSYFDCIALFRSIEEGQTLIITLQGKITNDAAIDKVGNLKVDVANGIKTVQKSDQLTIDDVAFSMGTSIKLQAEKIEKDIFIEYLTFQDTKMASSFSKRLTDALESELVKQGFQIKRNTGASQIANQSKNNCSLTGTYWEEGEYLKVILILRDNATGKAIASSEGLMPIPWLVQRSIAYKPANYDIALNYINNLNKDDVVSAGLNVEFFTNKGLDNLIFTEGETMKLFVKTNKECYIRFIYYLADGQKTLLLDNYRIDNSQANQIIEIPTTFECYPPFGAEILQLNAQTKAFDHLSVSESQGYKIISNSLNEIIVNNRGFKPKNDEEGIAEKRITITTMSK